MSVMLVVDFFLSESFIYLIPMSIVCWILCFPSLYCGRHYKSTQPRRAVQAYLKASLKESFKEVAQYFLVCDLLNL